MISTAVVAQYLEGLEFPAKKEQILEYAEERNAPPDMIDQLSDMPEPADANYYSMASVWDALGDIE